MNRRMQRGMFALLAAPAVATAAGCVHRYWRTEAVALDRPASASSAVAVGSPVKAHLIDGSIVVFADGASSTRAAVVGLGTRYSARLQLMQQLATVTVPFDSIVGLETFEGKLLQTQSVVVSAAARTAVAAATAAELVLTPDQETGAPDESA